jgi:hypothetical protein
MDRSDPHLVVAATFADRWHAEVAAGYLIEFDIPARVEPTSAEDPFRAVGAAGAVKLLVPADRLAEAHGLLAETMPEPDDEDWPGRAGHGRPVWVYPVALVLLIGLLVAAIPASMRVPALAIAVVGLLVWRKTRSV